MTRPRLTPATLPALPAAVARPAHDRQALAPGIVHLGLGAFARAHLAVATEAAIAADPAQPDVRWGIVGVSLRQPDTRDALAPQAGLYTVTVRDADAAGRPRQALQVVGALTRLLVAPEDPGAVLEALAHPRARIASLTVTEKGYLRHPAGGGLWREHPDTAHDLAHPQAPRSAVGFLVHGLALRRARGLGPLTLMSLDNLPANGHTLRALVLAMANEVDPALAQWIEARCTARAVVFGAASCDHGSRGGTSQLSRKSEFPNPSVARSSVTSARAAASTAPAARAPALVAAALVSRITI